MTADDAMRFLAVGAAVLAMLLIGSLACLVWDAHRRRMYRRARQRFIPGDLLDAATLALRTPTDAELDRLWAEIDGMLR